MLWNLAMLQVLCCAVCISRLIADALFHPHFQDVNSARQLIFLQPRTIFFSSYRYKPLSAAEDELNRWRLLTKKYHYEMINQEPRIGINGMWKIEFTAVDKKAKEYLLEHGK